ncbi:MAG: histidine ammonia-lyase [Caldilineales bacterium]|nr:histidine ammonia-lyase [Caldilineales bacterium]
MINMLTIDVDGHSLTIEQVVAVAKAHPGEVVLRLTPEAVMAVERASRAVEQIVEESQVVYGITTGFGAFKNKVIPPEQIRQLQRNIIRSHSAGTGPALPIPVVRAMMLARANALASGHSGIRLPTLRLLLDMIERGVHPVIPRQGSLGASGDLAQLAHMTLIMIGEGFANVGDETLPGDVALARAGLAPVELSAKEGLALTNGTAYMAALGCLAVDEAENCAFVATVAGALSLEALQGTVAAFDARIHAVRPHPRQQSTAERLRQLLDGSEFIRTDLRADPQDAYTLRCIPQVHGACADAVAYARWVVEIELNSVTDNPIIFFEEDGSPTAISGGNFHGEPLAIAFDYLSLAMTELGNISERRLNRLIDPARNGNLLPAFLTDHGGLNSGFMLTQYTAAALASENKALCHPASADTIPTSADVEDHVSNGPIAGRQARRVLRNLEQMLGIELMAAAQAVDFRRRNLGEHARLGRGTAVAYSQIRYEIPFLAEDAILAPYMAAAADLVASGRLRAAVQDILKSSSEI